eukprot:TRINITY_DN8695_c0_g1_i2.p1 TRINITY_DN8695_c0_g1~~TRINITY_DN8695_c0_g1_i2.p1  ORF type:complete len:2327 (-),score=710.37 TRINITY_DN8695_c0_g1_i2:62-7000(-)
MGCFASKKATPETEPETEDEATATVPSQEQPVEDDEETKELIKAITDRIVGIRRKAQDYCSDLQSQVSEIENAKCGSLLEGPVRVNGVVTVGYKPDEGGSEMSLLEGIEGQELEILVRDMGGWAYCRRLGDKDAGWLPADRVAELAQLIADHEVGDAEGLLNLKCGEQVEVISRHYSGWAQCRRWNGPVLPGQVDEREIGWVTDAYLQDNRSEAMLASKWHRLVLQALDEVVVYAQQLEGYLAEAKPEDRSADPEWMEKCMQFCLYLGTELQSITDALSQHEQSEQSAGKYATLCSEVTGSSQYELSLAEGARVFILEADNADWAWCRAEDEDGKPEGWLPRNILRVDHDADESVVDPGSPAKGIPAWIKVGDMARWWSTSQQQYCDVTISTVDKIEKTVVVTFVQDTSCWRSVPFAHFDQKEEDWLLQPMQDKAKELVNQLPSWVKTGRTAYWWSESQKRIHAVIIKDVSSRTRQVKVAFQSNKSVKKLLNFHELIDNEEGCLLQKERSGHKWRKPRKTSKGGSSVASLEDLEGVEDGAEDIGTLAFGDLMTEMTQDIGDMMGMESSFTANDKDSQHDDLRKALAAMDDSEMTQAGIIALPESPKLPEGPAADATLVSAVGDIPAGTAVADAITAPDMQQAAEGRAEAEAAEGKDAKTRAVIDYTNSEHDLMESLDDVSSAVFESPQKAEVRETPGVAGLGADFMYDTMDKELLAEIAPPTPSAPSGDPQALVADEEQPTQGDEPVKAVVDLLPESLEPISDSHPEAEATLTSEDVAAAEPAGPASSAEGATELTAPETSPEAGSEAANAADDAGQPTADVADDAGQPGSTAADVADDASQLRSSAADVADDAGQPKSQIAEAAVVAGQTPEQAANHAAVAAGEAAALASRASGHSASEIAEAAGSAAAEVAAAFAGATPEEVARTAGKAAEAAALAAGVSPEEAAQHASAAAGVAAAQAATGQSASRVAEIVGKAAEAAARAAGVAPKEAAEHACAAAGEAAARAVKAAGHPASQIAQAAGKAAEVAAIAAGSTPEEAAKQASRAAEAAAVAAGASSDEAAKQACEAAGEAAAHAAELAGQPASQIAQTAGKAAEVAAIAAGSTPEEAAKQASRAAEAAAVAAGASSEEAAEHACKAAGEAAAHAAQETGQPASQAAEAAGKAAEKAAIAAGSTPEEAAKQASKAAKAAAVAAGASSEEATKHACAAAGEAAAHAASAKVAGRPTIQIAEAASKAAEVAAIAAGASQEEAAMSACAAAGEAAAEAAKAEGQTASQIADTVGKAVEAAAAAAGASPQVAAKYASLAAGEAAARVALAAGETVIQIAEVAGKAAKVAAIAAGSKPEDAAEQASKAAEAAAIAGGMAPEQAVEYASAARHDKGEQPEAPPAPPGSSSPHAPRVEAWGTGPEPPSEPSPEAYVKELEQEEEEAAAHAPASPAMRPGTAAQADPDEDLGTTSSIAEVSSATALLREALRLVVPDTWDSDEEKKTGRRRPDPSRLASCWEMLEKDLAEAEEVENARVDQDMERGAQASAAKIEDQENDLKERLEQRAKAAESKLDPTRARELREISWSVGNSAEAAKEKREAAKAARVGLARRKVRSRRLAVQRALGPAPAQVASPAILELHFPGPEAMKQVAPFEALAEAAEAAKACFRALQVVAMRPPELVAERIPLGLSEDMAAEPISPAEGPVLSAWVYSRSAEDGGGEGADLVSATLAAMPLLESCLASLEERLSEPLPEVDPFLRSIALGEDKMSKEQKRDKIMFEGQQENDWERSVKIKMEDQFKRRRAHATDGLNRVDRVLRRRWNRQRDRDKKKTMAQMVALTQAMDETEVALENIFKEQQEATNLEAIELEAEKRRLQEQTRELMFSALIIRQEKARMDKAWYAEPREKKKLLFQSLKIVRRLNKDMKDFPVLPEFKQKHSVLLYSLRMLEARLMKDCVGATDDDIHEGALEPTKEQKKQLEEADVAFEEQLSEEMNELQARNRKKAERAQAKEAAKRRQAAEAELAPALLTTTAALRDSERCARRAEIAADLLRPIAAAMAQLGAEAFRHAQVEQGVREPGSFAPKQKRLEASLRASLKLVAELRQQLDKDKVISIASAESTLGKDPEWEAALRTAEKRWTAFCDRYPATYAEEQETPRGEMTSLNISVASQSTMMMSTLQIDDLEEIDSPAAKSPKGHGSPSSPGTRNRRGGRGAPASGTSKPPAPPSRAPAPKQAPQRPPSAGGIRPPAKPGGAWSAPAADAQNGAQGGKKGAALLAQLDQLSAKMDSALDRTLSAKKGTFSQTQASKGSTLKPPGSAAGRRR